MSGRHAAPSWWERQGYRPDHSVHSGTDYYVKGTEDVRAKVLEEGTTDQRGGADIPISKKTKSSNRSRPRTLAAGYDYGSDTLRVVFREGAVYDYFDVSTAEWWRFQRSASPGRFINRVLADREYTRIS